jgi:hypothetical protein
MNWAHIDEKKLKTLIKQISGTITEKDGELVPYHAIKGKGDIWCYHLTTKTMVRILRGSNIYVLDMGAKQDIQCLIYTEHGVLILIDKDEIIEIGYD